MIGGMVNNKAPVPDGFSMAFFHDCWEVVRENIMKVFNEFHSFGKFKKSLNVTFITLVPKWVGAAEVKDFRPVSLPHEIICKVLGNCMSIVMSSIISKVLEFCFDC